MSEVFKLHNKSLFEIIAFSFGPNKQDDWRKKVVQSFDNFIDVTKKSDYEISNMARELKIDIAVDLKGYTKGCRPRIFGDRCAPIQVSYLGYPGTMSTEYIDYLFADEVLIPEDKQKYYSEKIVYLPNSYQANSSKRVVSMASISRDDFGLPKSGFIFCCFNNSYKITPLTFSSWMRILQQVDGSVLWLLENDKNTSKNLKIEAKKLNIDSNRLIFTEVMPIEEHLNRIQLADLFLDTLPCNAHTTASDSLRMGVPVLTCIGNSFSSRVSASLLNAVNLPELITKNYEQYESLAIKLGTNPLEFNRINESLALNLKKAPLFKTDLFTKNIENAYRTIYDRYHRGLAPQHTYL
jgi:predicted O-linked N-acetylglucosamine transferase (SPINDLY family)